MTAFLLLAGALVAGVVLLIVAPLLGIGRPAPDRRSPDQARSALVVLREHLDELERERESGRIDPASYLRERDELAARALEEGATASQEEAAAPVPASPPRHPGWALATVVSLPLAALGLYLMLGEPAGLDPAATGQAPTLSEAQIDAMVTSLADRLAREPDNAEGWQMLARSYTVMERFGEAAAAYARLAALRPDNPDVLADWADVLAASQDGRLAGEPLALLERALARDPQHIKSLALAGSAAFQNGNPALAAERWQGILTQIAPDDPARASLEASIARARAQADSPRGDNAAPSPAPAPDASGTARALTLGVTVRLAPALTEQASPDQTVFVFVRAPAGGPPLASLRSTVADLPLTVDFARVPALIDGRPVPEQVVVGARISRRGDPVGAPGDLEGLSGPIAPDRRDWVLEIDRVRD